MRPSDGLSREELLRRSRGNLVDVILAQIGQVTLLQRELATATWEAQLLANQRDALLAFMKQEEESGSLKGPDGADYRWIFGQIYQIMISDPRDEVRSGPE